MNEPTITCPNCKTNIKLTESLAAPLIQLTRREFEKRLRQKDVEISEREAEIIKDRVALNKDKAALEDQVDARLKTERQKIAEQ